MAKGRPHLLTFEEAGAFLRAVAMRADERTREYLLGILSGKGLRREPLGKTIPLPEAIRALRLSRSSLDRLLAREVFTAIRPQGKGRGGRIYLFIDEVELFAETREADAVRELRARKRRLPKRRER